MINSSGTLLVVIQIPSGVVTVQPV